MDGVERPRQPIHITMPDGSQKDGTSWETSPMDIAKALGKSLAERVVIAEVFCSVIYCPIMSLTWFPFRWMVHFGTLIAHLKNRAL